MRGARWKQSDRPSATSIPSLCSMTIAENQLALTQIQLRRCCRSLKRACTYRKPKTCDRLRSGDYANSDTHLTHVGRQRRPLRSARPWCRVRYGPRCAAGLRRGHEVLPRGRRAGRCPGRRIISASSPQPGGPCRRTIYRRTCDPASPLPTRRTRTVATLGFATASLTHSYAKPLKCLALGKSS
jgi:hypothetical protein